MNGIESSLNLSLRVAAVCRIDVHQSKFHEFEFREYSITIQYDQTYTTVLGKWLRKAPNVFLTLSDKASDEKKTVPKAYIERPTTDVTGDYSHISWLFFRQYQEAAITVTNVRKHMSDFRREKKEEEEEEEKIRTFMQ